MDRVTLLIVVFVCGVLGFLARSQVGLAEFNKQCEQSEGVTIKGYGGKYHCMYQQNGGIAASFDEWEF